MKLVPVRSLVANRHLGALVIANGISAVGNWLYLTAIPVLVYRETEDPALVGLAAAARLLPWLLLSIPAGALADRFPGPRLLLVTEFSRAALMFLMAGLVLASAPIWIVFGVALAAVVAGTFAMPAHGTLIPNLARTEVELGAANVLSSTLDNVACIVGPAIAGGLIVVGGLELAFALNGLSFVVVGAVLLGLVRRISPRAAPERPTTNDEESSGTGMLARWVSIARESAALLAMDAAISFTAGAMFIAPVLIAAAQPGGSVALVGPLSASAGLGGLAGAVTAGAFVQGRTRQGVFVGVAAAVASLALLGGSIEPVFAIGAIGLVSAAVVHLDTLNTTLLQRSTPADRLGRTFGLLNSLGAGWVMAGSIVMGTAAQLLGIGSALIVCAAVVASLGGLSLAASHRPRPVSLPHLMPLSA